MALGTLTILASIAAVGPVRHDRCTVVGDGAYPSGGSLGLENLLRAAAGNDCSVFEVQPVGDNGDTHLEYTPKGKPVEVTAAAATDLFTSATAHGFSSGDAVYVEIGGGNANKPNPKLPTGVALGTAYYVIASGLTTTAFKVSATSGGSAIDLTSDSAGEIQVRKADKLLVRVMSTGIESSTSNQSGTTYSFVATSA